MTDMLETTADGLIARFKKRVEAHAGMPFAETGVTVPPRDVWLDYASAALEAMRVPSDTMINEMLRMELLAQGELTPTGPRFSVVPAVWGAAIDAALHKEG